MAEKLETFILKKFKDVSDFELHNINKYKIFLVSSLVNVDFVNKLIMNPLLLEDASIEMLPIISLKKETSFLVAEDELLRGSVIVCKDKKKDFFIVTLPSDVGRGIEPSEQESTLYTSLASFTEQLNQNLTLIRRVLPTSNLKSCMFSIGDLSKSKVAILYLETHSNEKELNDLKEKINKIKVEFVTNSAFLARLLSSSNSSFPEYQLSDRPDFVGLSLSKGKFVILMDQTPFVIIGPSTFYDFFLSAEDYIFNTWTAYFFRVLRLAGYFSSLLLVPIYVAFTTHHYEGFPIEVLFLVIESRSDVPFPPLWEALLMLITMEFLKEASKRMPTKTGNTLGIVGGIIIGDAAVQAGLASNILIVLVGITAVSSFLVPNYIMGSSTIILRFLLLMLSFAFGMFGIVAGFCMFIIHLNSKNSINRPYLYPYNVVKER